MRASRHYSIFLVLSEQNNKETNLDLENQIESVNASVQTLEENVSKINNEIRSIDGNLHIVNDSFAVVDNNLDLIQTHLGNLALRFQTFVFNSKVFIISQFKTHIKMTLLKVLMKH